MAAVLASAAVTASAAGAASPPPAAAAQDGALPSFEQVRAAHRPSDLSLLDRHGTPLQSRRVDFGVRRLPWVALEDISPALLQAIVLSEDRRFWAHAGVDWPAVARSAWANLLNTRTQGASTLTMQLAGLIDAGLARPAGGRDVAQKIGQVVMASRLEASWRKSQILEAYLNAVPFRGELVGIGALSQTLFHKHPSGLDAQEAALAAALVRSPGASAPRVAERACGVLTLQGLGCEALPVLAATALAQRGGRPLGEQLAPHLARLALDPAGPLAQRSTLDAGLQRVALGALRQQLAELQGRNVEDGAVIVLDNASGEVLAWVGSSGDFSDAPAVDGVLARRQPGSTLKPFLYGLAFERRLITPASLLDDSPAQIATGAGLYAPQNYDRDFRGWVSARTALGASLNVPAVRVGTLLPPDAFFERLNALGLALPHSGGHYGHALALGGADVTLLALANAYRTLANGGMASPAIWRVGAGNGTEKGAVAATGTVAAKGAIPGAQRPRRVMDAASAHLVTDILADNNARAGTFGLSSSLATRGFAAVKTGTSKDLRDNWCIGFTDRFTVGVWVGNASGEPMHGVSGVSGAAPVWRSLVQHLHAARPSRPPAAPAGIVALPVSFDAAREPARAELFITGTQQARQLASAQVGGAAHAAGSGGRASVNGSNGGSDGRFGITEPRSGSVFALDPDIPPSAQRIRFEGEAGTWVLNGRRIGQGPRITWAPWPGRHELQLLGTDGRVQQAVWFEVRGATVRGAQAAADRQR